MTGKKQHVCGPNCIEIGPLHAVILTNPVTGVPLKGRDPAPEFVPDQASLDRQGRVVIKGDVAYWQGVPFASRVEKTWHVRALGDGL